MHHQSSILTTSTKLHFGFKLLLSLSTLSLLASAGGPPLSLAYVQLLNKSALPLLCLASKTSFSCSVLDTRHDTWPALELTWPWQVEGHSWTLTSLIALWLFLMLPLPYVSLRRKPDCPHPRTHCRGRTHRRVSKTSSETFDRSNLVFCLNQRIERVSPAGGSYRIVTNSIWSLLLS